MSSHLLSQKNLRNLVAPQEKAVGIFFFFNQFFPVRFEGEQNTKIKGSAKKVWRGKKGNPNIVCEVSA